jgi:hypothetical protein
MGFSYNFIYGLSFNSYKNNWGSYDKEEGTFMIEKTPTISNKYIPYLSYEGNDLYYFFEDMMSSFNTYGLIIVSNENFKKIPSFQDYYRKTSIHYNDDSDEFKLLCRDKYYHLFTFFQHLVNKYENSWFITYKF